MQPALSAQVVDDVLRRVVDPTLAHEMLDEGEIVSRGDEGRLDPFLARLAEPARREQPVAEAVLPDGPLFQPALLDVALHPLGATAVPGSRFARTVELPQVTEIADPL